MRRFALILALILALPGVAWPNELLDLYDLALQRDSAWQAAGHARDAAFEAKPQARARLLPQVTLTAEQTFQHDEAQVVGAGTLESNSQYGAASLSLTQPILDWSTFEKLRQANDEVALADLTWRKAAQDLALRVTEAYFNTLAADDALRSARAESAAVRLQLEQAQARFNAELSAITEVREAQARYDLAEARLIAAEQTLQTTRSVLAEITGKPIEPSARLLGELDLPTPQLPDSEAWAKAAQEHNPDVLIARLNAAIARTGIRLVKSEHLPTLSLSASKFLSEDTDVFGNDRATARLKSMAWS